MRRSSRLCVPSLLAALLCGATGTHAAGAFSVGSFGKSTSGAPVTQAVAHGLGVAPKAILFWTNGKTTATASANYLYSFGMTDGTTSAAIATSSDDNVGTSAAHRRIASKALSVMNAAGTVLAEADLQSSDATNFTLNWTTNNATAYVVHFVAIGGNDISAKVLTWALALATGNQAVTGTGFMPDVVLHAQVGVLVSSIPSTTTHAGQGLSVMDRNGSQWASFQGLIDASAISDTQRYQRSNKSLAVILNDLSVSKEATYVSMDSNGFTVNVGTTNSWDNQVASLALKGARFASGCFNKSTSAAPASQSITGLSFRPSVVLLASTLNTSSTVGVSQARFGIGAGTTAAEGASAWQDTDALDTTSTDGIDKTDKIFIKMNNDTRTVDAEADLTSMDATGFTLNWTTNDAIATEVCYLALAGPRRVLISDRGRGNGGAGARYRRTASATARRARPSASASLPWRAFATR